MPRGRRSRLGEAFSQVAKERRIADRHGLLLGQLDVGSWPRAKHCKRHREPVVGRRLDPTPRWLIATFDVQIVPARFKTTRNPVRVGLTPTFSMRSSPSSASTAAATRNAALDGSPGTESWNDRMFE